MSSPTVHACDRCGRPLADLPLPALAFGSGADRRAVCADCLSWEETDLVLSLPAGRRDDVDRFARFLRDGVPAAPGAST
jgi:hypothetical protein